MRVRGPSDDDAIDAGTEMASAIMVLLVLSKRHDREAARRT